MSLHKAGTGPLVQFVRTWVKRIGDTRPQVGDRWVVDGTACVVTRVVILDADRWRVYVERDLAFTVPTSSLDAPPVHSPMGRRDKP